MGSRSYAQTAAYGLFTARIFEHTTLLSPPTQNVPEAVKQGEFSLEKAAYLIPKANPFLSKFFEHIASPNLNSQPPWLIEQIANSLRYVDVDKVLHKQSKKQGFEDPIFHFYETFLAEYDQALRKARGVYYTPEPVVSFIVRGVDWALKKKLDKPEGLAEKSALILDPAAGTATFLRKVIATIYDAIVEGGNAGVWPQYVRDRLLLRVFGFELIMAPYTVAHLKLELQLQEQGFVFQAGERLHVYLTNTLDQLHKKTNALLGDWIARENEGAEVVKRERPVVVVIGNPPYSGESQNKSTWIADLLQSYKKEPEGVPLREKNSKWINDDYVKFIRFAHDRVVRTGYGMVAFITNHGWLDNPTFRGMRAQIMRDFDEIYVLDLHGNSNKREHTPAEYASHGEDKNVFDIEQGVAITFLLKREEQPSEFVLKPSEAATPQLAGGDPGPLKATVRHADLWGSREFKYEWLETKAPEDVQWQALKPRLPQLLFIPRDDEGAIDYELGWKVSEIFPLNGTGVVTKSDDLNIHFSKDECFEAMKWFAASTEEKARARFRLPGPNVRDWKFHDAVTDLKKSGLDSERIVKILYRPFDLRYVYYSGVSRGVMGWPVVRIMRHFLELKELPNLGLVCAKQSKDDWGAFVTETIGGHKACVAYDINTYLPLWLVPKDIQAGVPVVKQRYPNLSRAFLARVGDALGVPVEEPHGLPQGVSPTDVLAYVYAVLCAPSFRKRYATFLKNDFPRIPIGVMKKSKSNDPFSAVWAKLIILGSELVELHRLRQVPSGGRPKFPIAGDGSVDTVRFEQGDDPVGRVWINATQYFDGVDAETWQFRVGGYQVCQRWLKDRKGRRLSLDDIETYGKIVSSIKRTHVIASQVDALADGALW